MSGHI